MTETDDGFWIFAYGSLLWNPGFAPNETRHAVLHGFHRSFCMASIHYRGTREAPGLVLALDWTRGARCEGLAYHVAASDAASVRAQLRARELISAAYLEVTHPLDIGAGQVVEALCYVIDPKHEQYRGGLSLAAQAEMIAPATGSAGANRDYLFQTLARLDALNLHDADMATLGRLVGERS